jgi:hypothetical protein
MYKAKIRPLVAEPVRRPTFLSRVPESLPAKRDAYSVAIFSDWAPAADG